MRQAYAHIEIGNTYYQELKDKVLNLAKNWNDTHNSKCNPQVIFDDCKRIFKYHKWISIDDIDPAFDLGLMGEFGENKGLNSETIFKWFTGHSKAKSKNELQGHTAYKTETTFISMEQRRKTRDALIDVFMDFFDEYQKTKIYNPLMDHYIPVFYRWFKKLQYITSTEEQDVEIAKTEAMKLSNMRSFLSRKPDQKINTQKKIFIENFILAAENNYPIEEQLKKMKL